MFGRTKARPVEVHVARYVKVESARVPDNDGYLADVDAASCWLLMLVIGIADAVEEKTPDSAVIVDSEGGRLGVIGWGANCFCL